MTHDSPDPTDAMTEREHRIVLRDVCDDELVATYRHIIEGRTVTEGRHVSTRLPIECLTIFEAGSIDVTDLTTEERDWVRAESRARSNEIDFEGTQTAEVSL